MTKQQIGLGFKGILNSLPAIVVALLTANAVGAWAFMVLEKGYSYMDSFYWAWVTSMSIGYGDISPATTAGRFVAILLGAFVLYVITPLVVGKFVMSALEDQNKFDHAEQEQIKRDTKITAENQGLINVKLDDLLFVANQLQRDFDRVNNVR